MLRPARTIASHYSKLLHRQSINGLYYQSRFNQSNKPNEPNLSKLFNTDTDIDSITNTTSEHVLTRSDFGFYQKLLPIDTVQEAISSIHFLFETPYWAIVLAIPFVSKMCITIPIHIYQQQKYEKRLPTLHIAMYETFKLRTKVETKTNISDLSDLKQKKTEIKNKYGYSTMPTQILPYTAAIIQLPIHLTMFISLRTMHSKYALWSDGGPQFKFLSNFSDLSLIDCTYILPLSVGCTMGILQYIMYKRNEMRSAGINANGLKIVNTTATFMFAYLSMNWSIGFNFYVLSNILSYVIQTKLMDLNEFRNMVGLKKYNDITNDVKRMQIMMKCIALAGKQKQELKVILNDLQNFDKFNNICVEQKDLDIILKNISQVEDNESTKDFIDADIIGEKEYLSRDFMSKQEIENRRKQIGNTMKNSDIREFDDDEQEILVEEIHTDDIKKKN